ncbi:MAG: hypothetical protein R3A80_02690 [Bdellovibrionota bacterium]
MKVFSLITSLLLSLNLYSVEITSLPVSYSNKVSKAVSKDGNYEYEISSAPQVNGISPKTYKLTDNDGYLSTLLTVRMLQEELSVGDFATSKINGLSPEQLKVYWVTVSQKPIESWKQAQYAMHFPLRKMKASYEKALNGASGPTKSKLLDRIKKIETLIKLNTNDNMTYGQLVAYADFLNEAQSDHIYDIESSKQAPRPARLNKKSSIAESDLNNAFFWSGGIAIPPNETGIRGRRYDFEVDYKAILGATAAEIIFGSGKGTHPQEEHAPIRSTSP